MKHLKKFEELDYDTYTSAAGKFQDLGQKERAKKLREHGAEMERKKIDEYKFNILVGEVRTYNDATFKSLDILREKTAYSIVCNFHSEPNNAHRVCATIGQDGTISWRDYNKFADRKSVNNFLTILKILGSYQPNFVGMLNEMNLTPAQLKLSSRTFYI